ncbi:hypothetical protein [Neolewinella sp.]|uniref:hypothetical protein n=1 Tax=Neolewinella sp. TaxID=2993543 RepID=UPI003B518FF9
MIGDTTLDSGYGSGLMVDGPVAANLRNAGKWARFVGIALLIVIGLSLIPFLFTGTAAFSDPAFGPIAAFATPFLIVVVAVTLFSLYLYYLVFDFGRKAMRAVDNNDQLAMQSSIASLSKLFSIIGILVVVYLVIIGVVFVGSIAAGMLAG